MSIKKAELLIVDDDPALRTTLKAVLRESGYEVRSAEDGFSALSELRNGIPDIILSDLNMAGMSGFELLSVIRRRFPAVQIIAMSGAYSGKGIPPGVAADAFYEKGSDLAALLRIIDGMSQPKRAQTLHQNGALTPIWISHNGYDHAGKPHLIITCPECLRTFPGEVGEIILPVHETNCVYCHSVIHYAIVQPNEPAFAQSFQRKPVSGIPTAIGLPDLN
jgi:CheY-like chemotaxis protein